MTFTFSAIPKRIYLAVATTLVIGLAYKISLEVQSDSHSQFVDQLSMLTNEDPVVMNAKHELASAQHALAESQPTPVAELQPEPGAKRFTAWSIDDASAQPAMPIPTGVSVYAPVAVDMETPAYPQPGDRITMVMPGGGKVTANVKFSATNPNGDYSWRGHMDGYGADDYPVVMTYGANSVFATVTTPEGSYTLESVNGSGWIYKNPSEFELSEHGANDFLEIPHDH